MSATMLAEVDLFRSPAVCEMAGVTYRQLDYWARIGLLKPVQEACGSGTQRRFTADQVAAVRALRMLLPYMTGHERFNARHHRHLRQVVDLIEDGAEGDYAVIADGEVSITDDGPLRAWLAGASAVVSVRFRVTEAVAA